MAPHTSLTPKKRGRPVGSKKKVIDFPKDWGKIKVDGKLVDFTTMLEVPDSEATVEQVKSWVKFENINNEVHFTYEGKSQLKNVEVFAEKGGVQLIGKLVEKPKMSLANKITLILTVVNVAILISLVIKNV